ncbi:type I secretion C-terminal target domain-containing protein [Methylophilus sp. OH31]|uniref:M10 family metallopeptidase C-terminal domain-containing protein n=1 Tax=Methylophilus sp. OH31 TaxID=1387312 RepID=UPI0004639F9A|nr:type I secretion C-terminal target domain-containing protein [Methylophilus sp. OH31]
MTAPTPDTTSEISIFDASSSSSNPYINVLLLGNKWGGSLGSAATVYYSFPTSRSDEYWSQDFINGYGIFDPTSDGTPDYVSLTPLSASQQNGITQALNAWASVANLNFIKVDETPSAVGDIRFGFTLDGAMSPETYAYSYNVDPDWHYPDILPYTRSGDIWFNKNQPDQTGNNFSTGAMGYFVGLHEIGHSLGLDHSFAEEDGDLGLPTNLDYIQYTVMSYSDQPGINFDGRNEYYPTTPMLYDILALQYLYGANNSYNADDTVYEFSSSQRYYQTIWDAGGNDTIKYASSIGGVINLEAGSFSQLGKTFKVGVNNNFVQKDNIAIAFNVVIENAIGGSGGDKITGNSADNRLEGAGGDDTIDGSLGADTLVGGKGNDTYIVDNINDVITEFSNEGTDLVKTSVTYTLSDHVENLILIGTDGIDGTGNDLGNIMTGNDANNSLYGNDGVDTLNGAAGNDILDGGAGVDKLIGGAGDDTYIVDLVRTGTTTANYKVALQDTITETAAAGSGNDTVILRGGSTDPTTFTTLTLGTNLENLNASLTGSTKLNLTGNALANTLTGNDANNILDGGVGADTLIGGLGNDTYVLDLKVSAGNINFEDTVTEHNGTTEGIDTVKLRGTANLATAIDISLTRWTNIETLDASATGVTKLTLKGNDEDNTLIGNSAGNKLEGGLGNDILNGGAGADTMIGGKGWDTYYVDNIKDVIVELENTDHVLADEGIDTINSSISLSLANYANVEYLTLLGTANLNATGNDGSNLLIGNAGNNILDGGGNRDDMQGGAGNDTYIVDDINDQAIETLAGAAGGIDIVLSSVSFALNYNVENLTLTGTENIDGYGNELNNTIRGNAGNNRLGGGGDGSDTLIGGAGNDIYEVTYLFASSAKPVTQDTVIESLNAGIDSIILSAAGNNGLLNKYLMPLNVENLDATNTYGAFSHLIGNNSANYIIGNDYSHIFDGGAGVDTLVGGNSSDTYIVDLITNINAGVTTAALQDIIIEDASGAGSDTIQLRGNIKLTTATTLTLSAGLANVENLDASLTATSKLNLAGNDANNVLTGNAAANTLTGGLGNDTLNGGAGIDTMIGGDGDDTYIVDNIADIVTEDSNEGTDLVKASVSYTLGANIENLELTGAAAINGIGNDDANIITGNAVNNILDGKGGIDSLRGGKGNDTYIVDDEDDEVIENLNEGTDLVKASVSYTLSDNVENLTLTNGSANGGTAAINGTGNALANTITGNAGNNILDGGAGVDKLIGGAGNDTYIVDLQVKARYSGNVFLGSYLTLEDTIIEAKNAGNDTLVLRGNAPGGYSLTLLDNIENLDAQSVIRVDGPSSAGINLYGNALDNYIWGNNDGNSISGGAGNDTLYGGSGEDYLDGGEGTNTLVGGQGSDTYIIRNSADVIYESSNDSGVDHIFAYVSINMDLYPNVEYAQIAYGAQNVVISSSSGNIYGGSDKNDQLIGGNGNDTFLSSAGNDILTGGNGDDTYYVNSTGDIIHEDSNQGTDLVNASISYTLGSNLENLTLSGTTTINGIGNDLNNLITGNTANNVLSGGVGNDTLIGGGGNDTLSGGLGADVFKWTFSDSWYPNSTDTITDFSIMQGDALDLRDFLLSETQSNLQDYLEILTQDGNTEITISYNGQLNNVSNQNAHIVLMNTDLYALTGQSTQSNLIGYLIDHQSLLIS